MDKELLKDQIQTLAFLKYVDAKDHDWLLNELVEGIIDSRIFSFPSGENYTNLDGRLFGFDAESLVEGGALDYFNELRPTLEKAGLIVKSVEQVFKAESVGSKVIYHLNVNGIKANFSAVPVIPVILQGGIVRRFSKMLDTVLRQAGLNERIYFMNDKAYDTQIAILTKAQARFINRLGLNKRDRVYKFGYRTIWKPVVQIFGVVFSVLFKKGGRV